jgi:hypothetical protein
MTLKIRAALKRRADQLKWTFRIYKELFRFFSLLTAHWLTASCFTHSACPVVERPRRGAQPNGKTTQAVFSF